MPKLCKCGVYFERYNPRCPWRVRLSKVGLVVKQSVNLWLMWNCERRASVHGGGRSVWDVEPCLSPTAKTVESKQSMAINCLCYHNEQEPVAFLV